MRTWRAVGVFCFLFFCVGLWIIFGPSQPDGRSELPSDAHSIMRHANGNSSFATGKGIAEYRDHTKHTAELSYGAAADPAVRAERVALLRARSQSAREEAHAMADAMGVPVRGEIEGGQTYALIRLTSGGLPVYNYTRATIGSPTPRNFHSGISSHAQAIRERPPFMNRTGEGLLLGVWDAGLVMTNHVEFLLEGNVSRITLGDADEENGAIEWDDHGTHVGGTMVAAGVNYRARGMAPSARLLSYDWEDDAAEWLEVALAESAVNDEGVVVSNHSYGPSPGWGQEMDEEGNPIVVWAGKVDEEHRGESLLFGRYDEECRAFDGAVYTAPYTLPFFAAGNERSLSPAYFGLEEGDVYYVYVYEEGEDGEPSMVEREFDPEDPDLPKNNDFKEGGMNTLSGIAVAKNVMAVGAVQPAYSRAVRSPRRALMTDFSGWGPTDDGRIKPDIVSDGVKLLSVSHTDAEGYTYMTGTSMASPAAAGTAALLQDLHASWFDEFMSAALLKGLIIHTASDLGRPGPDYTYGWGLIDGQAAAEVLHEHFLSPDRLALNEGVLENAATNEYRVIWDGISPLSATLTWTDPPPCEELVNSIQMELNPTNSMLVHDLDLRIVGPDDVVHEPWTLDPTQPTNDATRGDNVRDNVERVDLLPTHPGEYHIVITHKGELNSDQPYGLVITGQRMTDGPRLKLYQQEDEAEYRIGQGGIWFAGVTTDLEPVPLIGRIANTGATTLHIDQGMKLNGDPALSVRIPPASSITPGSDTSFEIIYQPTAYGRASTQVEISHNERYQSPFFFHLMALCQQGVEGLPIEGDYSLSVTQHVGQAGVVSDLAVTLGLEGWLENVSLISPCGITNTVFDVGGRYVDVFGVTFTDRAATFDWHESPALGNEFRFLSMPVQEEFVDGGEWVLHVESSGWIQLTQFELAVEWVTPKIAFPLGQVFRESPENDGSIANHIELRLIGGQFSETAAEHLTIHHVPAGLTPVIERRSDSELVIGLDGNAEHHNRFNSVANLRVEIGDGAFETLTAADVRGLPAQGVMIDFIGDDGDLYVTTAPVAVPVEWLVANRITSSFHAAVLLDQNDNGYATWQHFVMDTDPTGPGSELAFSGNPQVVEEGIQLHWWGSSNRLYRIWGITNLVDGIKQPVGETIQPLSTGWQTITDTNLTSDVQFYRIEVQLP